MKLLLHHRGKKLSNNVKPRRQPMVEPRVPINPKENKASKRLRQRKQMPKIPPSHLKPRKLPSNNSQSNHRRPQKQMSEHLQVFLHLLDLLDNNKILEESQVLLHLHQRRPSVYQFHLITLQWPSQCLKVFQEWRLSSHLLL